MVVINNEKFKNRVFELVGDEYVFLEEYKKAKIKIKVKHDKCGKIYEVTPDNFYRGKRCPKCNGGVRKTNSEFVKEVKELVGDEYVFIDTYINGRTPIKVVHKHCSNEFKVSPSTFLRTGSRCPSCANKRRSVANTLSNAEFLKGMYLLVGDEYTFLEEYKGKLTKIKVRHNMCGYIYRTSPDNFKSGKRCKKCSDTEQRKTNEFFIREVFELVGNDYTFLEEYVGARKKIKVIHNKCNHVFSTTPNNFLKGNRCPNCFVSKGELAIESALKDRNITFIKEVSFNDLKREGLLRYDFGLYDKDNNLKLLMEYDGKQHFEPIEAWGGEAEFLKTLDRDNMKNEYAFNKAIPLKRIPYWEFDNIELIIEGLLYDIELF